MKTIFEEVSTESGSSINVMINPNLSDFYYWHFHPEIELVFIEGVVNGIRHIGNHISKYSNGDIALIGSNIPHLNFDYQVKGSYKKSVIQFLPEVFEFSLKEVEEFSKISEILQLARHGLCFGERTKNRLGKRIHTLNQKKGIYRLLELIDILHTLAILNDYSLLHQKPFENEFKRKEQTRLKTINQYITNHYNEKISLEKISEVAGMTPPAFCRYFKKMTKLTFSQFLNHYRIDIAKKLLLNGRNVSEAGFESGFESLSYFNRVFNKVTLENPSTFQLRHNLN